MMCSILSLVLLALLMASFFVLIKAIARCISLDKEVRQCRMEIQSYEMGRRR